MASSFELGFLVRRLGQPALEAGWQTRKAPSVVTRSEAEIFGISDPRFAVRYTAADGSFINARRLREFVGAIQILDATTIPPWARDYLGGHPHMPAMVPVIPEHPAVSLQFQSKIADSILSPPKQWNTGTFQFVSIDPKLFSAFGEPVPSGASVFTPFVVGISLGGGLCAQSSCFIVAVLLIDYVKSIGGLGEITLRSSPDFHLDRQKGAMHVSEMTSGEIKTYFKETDLDMTEQSSLPAPSDSANAIQANRLAAALKGYLRSFFPVLFPTNLAKLAIHPYKQESVYAQNGIPVSEELILKGKTLDELHKTKNNNHAAVFVGFDKLKDGEESLFVFHDPAGHPYLQISLRQILECGQNQYRVQHSGDETFFNDAGVIWPVTPRGVNLPLLYQRQRLNGRLHTTVGVIALVDCIYAFRTLPLRDREGLPHHLEAARQQIDGQRPGQFFLPDLDAFRSNPVTPKYRRVTPFADILPLEALEGIENTVRLIAERHPDLKWVWLQLEQNFMWVWNAQIPATAITEHLAEELEATLSIYLLEIIPL